MRFLFRKLRKYAAAAAMFVSTTTPAWGQNLWTNYTNTGNTWSTATNWDKGVVPNPSITTALIFGSVPQVLPPVTGSYQTVLSYTSINDFGTPFVLNQMIFDGYGSAGTNGGIRITSSNTGGGLNFQGTAPSILQNGTGSINFVNGTAAADIALNGQLTIGGAGLGNIHFNAPIGGSGGLAINATSSPQSTGPRVLLTPGAASSFAGGVTINTGNLVVSNANNPLGSGPVIVERRQPRRHCRGDDSEQLQPQRHPAARRDS